MADLLSDEEMGKLIDLYQEEENLYKYRSRDYHDRDKARESLEDLQGNGEELGR